MKKLLFMLTVLTMLLSLVSCDGAINLQKLDFYPTGDNSYVVAVGDGKHLEKIVIPKTYFGMPVVEIAEDGFRDCSKLESITIPNSVTSIGTLAFHLCVNLKNVEIPNSVTSIGSYAFAGCTSLETIVIPDSITRLEHSVFESCKSLTSVVIPDSVTSIERSVFENCDSLTSVVIPDSVTSIDANAFYCNKLKSIKYRGTEEEWKAIDKHDNWIYNHIGYTITYNYDGE